MVRVTVRVSVSGKTVVSKVFLQGVSPETLLAFCCKISKFCR